MLYYVFSLIHYFSFIFYLFFFLVCSCLIVLNSFCRLLNCIIALMKLFLHLPEASTTATCTRATVEADSWSSCTLNWRAHAYLREQEPLLLPPPAIPEQALWLLSCSREVDTGRIPGTTVPLSGASCVDIEPRWDVLTRRAGIIRSYAPSWDRTFLRAEPRHDVLTRRAKIGRSYAPSWDRTFLLPPDDLLFQILLIFALFWPLGGLQ